MHSVQIILVEAETPEDAFFKVATAFSEGQPDWSDWHNASHDQVASLNFSGRWDRGVFYVPDKEGNPDTSKPTQNWLRYSDEPALAELVIDQFLEYRMNDIRNYQKEAVDLSTYSYDPYAKKWDMALYSTKRLAELLNDNWTNDSAIFDLENWTPNLAQFLERVKNAPDKQFLIPVDFHH